MNQETWRTSAAMVAFARDRCWPAGRALLVVAVWGLVLLGVTLAAMGAEEEGGNASGSGVVEETREAPAAATDDAVTERPRRRPLLERIGPQRRAKVLSALAGLVILGLGMIFLTWLGARATRRYMNREPILRQKPPDATPLREKDWAEKPLGSPFDEEE